MPTNFTGGCLCGAIRYECSADPVFAGNCHCRDCQKASGSPFASGMGVPATAVKITGNVKYHDSQADSGRTFTRAAFARSAARACSAGRAVFPTL
jgi:hypothetical protein